MFVKPILKYNKTTREYYHVYRLCESVRRNGRIHHQKIIGLGKLEELSTDEQIKLLGSRIEALILNGGQTLPLDIIDSKIEKLAVHFYQEIIKQRRYDVVQGQGEWETVDISTLSNKDDVEIGAEWLCKQAFDQLGIGKFFKEQNWCDEKINLATTHIISRAVYPASEYKTVRFIKQNSGISELTGYDKEKITKDLLYGISHKLYSIRSQLSQYLSKRTNELFDLEDTIILYDLTNVHFEGKMRHSKIARFGKDKKKRKDVKIVALAVVINKEGMLKYANIFQGNIADCKTLKTMIETISCQTSFTTRKLLIVMDAGIATDDNIKMLKKSGYDYICVTRSKLKDFYADKEGELVSIKDKKNRQ